MKTPNHPVALRLFSLCLLVPLLLASCERPDPEVTIVASAVPQNLPPTPIIAPFTGSGPAPPTPVIQPLNPLAGANLPTYIGTPTPDPPRAGNGGSQVTHYVAAGETLGYIAQLYGSSIEELQTANQLADSNLLSVGQTILVPGQSALVSPSFKIIPDSELVYGPATKEFDARAFVAPFNSVLLVYQEEVEGQLLFGPEIVMLVAHRYSVNPRLLLAVIEYRSGWVTRADAPPKLFLLDYDRPNNDGLYRQLSWAANELNGGFYGRAEGGLTSLLVSDNTRVAFAPDINDGTAGVQKWLSAHSNATYQGWLQESGPDGFFAAYSRLFGNPFAYTVDPLWPADLAQPPLRLPWPAGETWYFTGGPHGGWAAGSAWAALDFVPPGEQLGCVLSDHWVTAMADGVVTRSDFGAVVIDMDGDGYAGTGWAITYMHLETRDRIAAGALVQAGDRLGHPSCEGGFSNGTHVHVARSYNGRWVAADGAIPFEMGGWVSQGLGREYDGLLVRGGVSREACECREEGNAITGD
jgi:LasA protease